MDKARVSATKPKLLTSPEAGRPTVSESLS